MDGTILVADDDRTIRTVLTQALTRAGCKVHATASLVTLMRWIKEGKGDLVISDVVMPDGNGLETLPKIHEIRPGLPVLVISAQNTIMTAIRAEAASAYDYLPKPFDLPDLLKRVSRALDANPRRPAAPDPVRPRGDLPLIGQSPVMQQLYRLIAKVVNSPLPVLIAGESGTGKSLIAKTLHDLSHRADQPLISPRPEDLTEGAAAEALIRAVGQGTLLIDKISDLTEAQQATLSRLIDALPEDGPRLLAISSGDLAQDVSEGRFREDLYYRLNGVTLDVPPLRDRLNDIPLLAAHFLPADGTGLAFGDEALAALRAYSWPGNVRQLDHTVRRLVATSQSTTISAAEVDAVLTAQPRPSDPVGGEGDRLSAAIEIHLRRYFDLHGGMLPPPGLYARILREMELPLIELSLDATGGNQAKCADMLGINRNTLRKKITDLDIEVTRRRKLM